MRNPNPCRAGLWLVLIIGSLFATPVLAETRTLALAAELQQTLTESPESLRWLAPNHDMELTHENIGLEPENCSKPVPAMVSRSTHRFLVRCETTQMEKLRMVDLLIVTSWTHADDGWETGQMVSVNRLGTRYGGLSLQEARRNALKHQGRVLLPLDRHEGSPSGPFEEAFIVLSEQRIEQLNAVWEAILTTEKLPLAQLQHWRDQNWPDGLVGLRKDGQLLLQKGSLTGAGALVKSLEEHGRLPEFAKGLIRPVPSTRSWQSARPPGEPMFMLEMMYANRTDYALAISDKAPESRQNNTQRMSEGMPFHLVFMPIERNL
ncbi:hypothetical protein [Marinobacter confluentis]|uniref:Uncharacterized protein n=1 Tax=Marinobacter confluentis TaxID=1697557 RepID=A0A4Z1C3M8_9GAMM|nr:hypothetical protein [Marinobacter confluentis]TGN39950.1 hypothetical protein E5Q11_06545 [Marinobacter confluentis]